MALAAGAVHWKPPSYASPRFLKVWQCEARQKVLSTKARSFVLAEGMVKRKYRVRVSMLAFPRDTTVSMRTVVDSVTQLGVQISRRVAKNELISAVVVNGGAQALADVSNATDAVAGALQSSVAPYAIAIEAGQVAAAAMKASRRPCSALAHDYAALYYRRPALRMIFLRGGALGLPFSTCGARSTKLSTDANRWFAKPKLLAASSEALDFWSRVNAVEAARELNSVNKYGFYETLADAALRHLAQNQPEPEDCRPLLKAVWGAALKLASELKSKGSLGRSSVIVIQSRDAEGNQHRRHYGPKDE